MKKLVQEQSNPVRILLQSISRSKVVSAAICFNKGKERASSFGFYSSNNAALLELISVNSSSCSVVQSFSHCPIN